jgi:SRSO17 transposase
MKQRELVRLDRDLTEYLECIIDGMGRRDRQTSARSYVMGLLLDGERKSIEPMASRLVDAPGHIQGMRQRLQECVSVSPWSDTDVLSRVAVKLEHELPGIAAFVVDDTGFPKKGTHSVGVMRQYSGTSGRIDNCQVAVSLHLAGEEGSGCIGFRLYLPETWASDPERRRKAGVPEDVTFQTKWEISLGQIETALKAGVERHPVLADAGYGDVTEFRQGLTKLGLEYVVGVNGTPVVWGPESNPQVPPRIPGKGHHPPTRYRDEEHPPVTITDLAATLSYRKIGWREGSQRWQSSRFAAARVRTAHKHLLSRPPGQEQWLLCEWPKNEKQPTKFWLSTLPRSTSIRTLVRFAKLRWRVERDYQEMKQEVGLDHFEGRSWRGFHHHATLCCVAHAFLALKRALFPPEHQEVDAPDGPPPSSDHPAEANRFLPALPSSRRSRRTSARTVEALNARTSHNPIE